MLPQIETVIAFARAHVQHAALFALAIVGGVALGLIRINSTAQLAQTPDRWALPNYKFEPMPPLDVDSLLVRFWSEQPLAPRKKAEPVVAAPPTKPWQFLGTIDQGSTRFAVIEIDGKAVRQLVPGDALPDGAVVTKVSEGELVFNRQGVDESIRLFLESKSE